MFHKIILHFLYGTFSWSCISFEFFQFDKTFRFLINRVIVLYIVIIPMNATLKFRNCQNVLILFFNIFFKLQNLPMILRHFDFLLFYKVVLNFNFINVFITLILYQLFNLILMQHFLLFLPFVQIITFSMQVFNRLLLL